MPERVLIVAAHPDDEVLGCGGAIARHAALGDEVHILIMAEGATARGPAREPDARVKEIEALRHAAQEAARILGAHPPTFAGLPDNRLDGIELLDVVKVVEAGLAKMRPSVVYTHHGGDLNVDHRIVHQAVVTACRPLPGALVRSLLAFETPSSTEWSTPAIGRAFQPTRFVDIAAHLEKKLDALRCYASEMRDFPHPRSQEGVDALARLRGATAGCMAAEAFEIVRELVSDA